MEQSEELIIHGILKLTHAETGMVLTEANKDMLETRIKKRMINLGFDSLYQYDLYLKKNLETEKSSLISLLTTHHSYFFREYFHFEEIETKYIDSLLEKNNYQELQIWSAACSQGQEPYSIAMLMEKLKKQNKYLNLNYKILASDIDQESINYAKNGVYYYKDIEKIPKVYITGNWQRGTGELRQYVKIKDYIKQRVEFKKINLLDSNSFFPNKIFDIIFCRNVLIYFNSEQINIIIKSILKYLKPNGILILGISETINKNDLKLNLIDKSIYMHLEYTNSLIEKEKISIPEKKLIHVFCIDDSVTILRQLEKILTNERGFKIVGTASSAAEARSSIRNAPNIDIVILDLYLPDESGIDYIKSIPEINNHPPILIMSSIERDSAKMAQEALTYGAVDYVEKIGFENIKKLSDELCFKIETIYNEYKENNIANKKNTYLKKEKEKIKILIVEDSETIRYQLKKMLSRNKDIEVVAELSDALLIEETIAKYNPDILTLDIKLPKMNGVEVLKRLIPKRKIPTIIVSSLNINEGSLVMDALANGAVDYFQKPKHERMEEEADSLIEKILNAKNARIRVYDKKSIQKLKTPSGIVDKNYLICIGSSTGGTEAIKYILQDMPETIPPILIVQHIPKVFSAAFAQSLGMHCQFEVVEAKNNDIIYANKVYIAPGGLQMKVERFEDKLIIKISEGIKGLIHKPSVDVLFHSVAELGLRKTMGIILTGMGSDGAKGLKHLKETGAITIAQNEESCVIFGMPKEAINLNAVDYIEPLENISNRISNIILAKQPTVRKFQN
ncbi:chemotaxis-specific protein-glutamate methyltransferase CheB [Fluviispira vulneris]|uniref:chemotaxis-specific protein-glutamate methyltransferase CheB n=1 Tax=Fluviispira vulneris TaxID=2763012 RepID=UPI00164947FD|nr:chemotaxis-specific protein-glutamate methyltransferase CheB [Fluviispira vulneris]